MLFLVSFCSKAFKLHFVLQIKWIGPFVNFGYCDFSQCSQIQTPTGIKQLKLLLWVLFRDFNLRFIFFYYNKSVHVIALTFFLGCGGLCTTLILPQSQLCHTIGRRQTCFLGIFWRRLLRIIQLGQPYRLRCRYRLSLQRWQNFTLCHWNYTFEVWRWKRCMQWLCLCDKSSRRIPQFSRH